MKKKEALAVMQYKIESGCFDMQRLITEGTRKEVKDQIRMVADEDEGFENVVFELGCSVLANQYLKNRK